jgi:hypothetical protein
MTSGARSPFGENGLSPPPGSSRATFAKKFTQKKIPSFSSVAVAT